MLDEVLEAQEIVIGPGLPVVRLGFDGPGRDLVVGGDLGPAHRGGKLIEPAELAQFGAEHAVVLRQPARIVALDIDDVSVLNAHVLSPDGGPTIAGHRRRQELNWRLIWSYFGAGRPGFN